MEKCKYDFLNLQTNGNNKNKNYFIKTNKSHKIKMFILYLEKAEMYVN